MADRFPKLFTYVDDFENTLEPEPRVLVLTRVRGRKIRAEARFLAEDDPSANRRMVRKLKKELGAVVIECARRMIDPHAAPLEVNARAGIMPQLIEPDPAEWDPANWRLEG